MCQAYGITYNIGDQLEQIEQEKVAATKVVEKKAEELRVKVKKADALFQLFKLGKNDKEGMEGFH